jgi:hypothetical protein
MVTASVETSSPSVSRIRLAAPPVKTLLSKMIVCAPSCALANSSA